MKLIECVANVSVGRNEAQIKALRDVFSENSLSLLHCDSHQDADRTVFSLAFPLENALETMLSFADAVFKHVQVARNTGVHPHVGSLDVCPFVPLGDTSMEEAEGLARAFAQAIWEEHGVPSCFYGRLAQSKEHERLHSFRKRGFSGFQSLLDDGLVTFDNGSQFHPLHGVCLVTARPLMLAYNVTLDTEDVSIAKKIASQLRAHSKSDYRMEQLEAIGWYMKQYQAAQVSMNVRAPERYSLIDVFRRVEALAGFYGQGIVGSELIGLIPRFAFNGSQDISEHDIEKYVTVLGLSYHKPFNARERVLEFCLEALVKRSSP